MDRATSLVKALDILSLLGGSTTALTVQEIASAMNHPRSTSVRILNTLVEYGIVSKEGKYYKCTEGFYNWALKDRYQQSRIRYRKVLEKVSAFTGELVLLGIQEGAGIVHIDFLDSDQAVRVAPAPATRHNIRRNAIGKLCIAQRPDLVKTWLEKDPQFSEELKKIQSTGIAWNHEESVQGMIAVACYGYSLSVTEPKIAVAWPSQRFTKKKGKEAIRCIQEALKVNQPLASMEASSSSL